MSSKNLSITALILGIASCVCAWFSLGAIIGLGCGIAGLIVSTKAKKAVEADMQLNPEAPNSKSMATAGLVLSIIGTVLAAIVFVCAICAVCALATVASSGYYYY